MRIGVDMMGGDYAPEATVGGAILAHQAINNEAELILIGDRSRIKEILKTRGYPQDYFEIIHADQIIQNGENPAKAFSKKPWSSIKLGFSLLYPNTTEILPSCWMWGSTPTPSRMYFFNMD